MTVTCLIFEKIIYSWNSLSDDSDMTGEIPQMFSENGTVGKPGKATGKRHDSSASASSHHSDEFGESVWRNNFMILTFSSFRAWCDPQD